MDFLKRIYFGNTVESYLVVLVTILAVLLLRRFLSKYIASGVHYFAKKTWRNIDKKKFVALVIKPLGWFITVSIAVLAIDKLNYPEELRFKIYHHSVENIIQKAGVVLIIITFIRLVVRLIDFIALLLQEKTSENYQKGNDQLVTFFRDFLKVFVNICGLFLIIKAAFNQDISTLLTGLSIIGAALALAAKESLENLIASFIIFFDKPFFTGDVVKVNAVTGTIEHIGLRSTRIRTTEKTLVTVPNKQMVDSVVDNVSLRTQRRAEIILEMAGKTGLENAQKFISAVKEMIESKKDIIQDYTLFINDYSKGNITATLEYFTGPVAMADFNRLKQEINIHLIKLRTEMDIEFPSTTPSVNIINAENDAEKNTK